MRHEEYRCKGCFIGSEVIETGRRSIVGQRLKQSGMFWSLRGANAVISLRCCLASNRFKQFWENSSCL